VFVTSRWFPQILALFVTTLHIGLIGYDFGAVGETESHYNARQYIRRDLERPFFEPSDFCGAYTRYSAVQSLALGLDAPAYVAAALLASAINRSGTCLETLMTPRGQVLAVVFVALLWFVVGLSIRRFAQRRWRNAADGRLSLAFFWAGLTPLPLAIFAMLLGLLDFFVSDVAVSVRLAGFAFWMLYISTLSAERLRLWPFTSI
jgi:hypothetical protein